jgi:hypothetical protein
MDQVNWIIGHQLGKGSKGDRSIKERHEMLFLGLISRLPTCLIGFVDDPNAEESGFKRHPFPPPVKQPDSKIPHSIRTEKKGSHF